MIRSMKTETTANIGTPETLPITDLHLYDRNPRQGDVQAIKSSMLANGIFRPIVVNKGTHTGKPNQVLAGNHSLKAMRELAADNPDDTRWSMVQVWMVDVDEDHAAKIVLADNRTADLGAYDDAALLDLIESLDTGLEGTGYNDDDTLKLLTSLADDNSMTEFIGDADMSGRDEYLPEGQGYSLNDSEPGEPSDGTFPQGESTEEGEEAESAAPSPGEPIDNSDAVPYDPNDYIILSFSTTTAQRRTVRYALNHVKEREELDTQVDALMFIVRDYLGDVLDEIEAEARDTVEREVTTDNSNGFKEGTE